MERRKAIFASAAVAVTLVLGAGSYVAGSGLLAGASDNVGRLSATTASPPREITVYGDPGTGASTTVVPPATDPSPSAIQDQPVQDQPSASPDRGADHQGGETDD